MTLSETLSEHVRACFTALWIESREAEDALSEIAGLCRSEDWTLAVWDIEQGPHGRGAGSADAASGDPLAAVRSAASLASPGGTALLVLVNFHRYLSSPEIVQSLARQIHAGKQSRVCTVILSPVVELPPELERQFVLLEHEPPNRSQLENIARGIAASEDELAENDLPAVLDAAAGLTRLEAEGAFSLSLVREGTLKPAAIWELKGRTLQRQGLLRLHRGGVRFAALGGLEALKSFCTRALARQENNAVRPRGVLLLGVSGTGKSEFAKALGAECGRPVLTLDVGALMGSLVGQTERNIRQALAAADAIAPCVLFVDECEKALSGLNGSGDGGVAARLFGTLLSWLNDHTSDVFVVCTANDVSRLPPEFTRAERFDAVYFLDLPDTARRQRIWGIHRQSYGLPQQPLPDDEGWTGAEIKSCCRLAALLNLSLMEAAANIVPVSATAAESIATLRNWASGRCLSADAPGLYQQQTGASRRRSVSTRPSVN